MRSRSAVDMPGAFRERCEEGVLHSGRWRRDRRASAVARGSGTRRLEQASSSSGRAGAKTFVDRPDDRVDGRIRSSRPRPVDRRSAIGGRTSPPSGPRSPLPGMERSGDEWGGSHGRPARGESRRVRRAGCLSAFSVERPDVNRSRWIHPVIPSRRGRATPVEARIRESSPYARQADRVPASRRAARRGPGRRSPG